MKITEDVVGSVAQKLSGSLGPGYTYLEALQGWLLKLREDSNCFRTSVEIFVNCMDNQSHTWESCRVFMSGRLISLDKQTGVHLVGIEETWIQLSTKCVLKVTEPKAPNTCQDEHICARLNVGIDGAVHRVQDIWNANFSTNKWGDSLVDATNAFKEINCIGML